MPILIVYRVIQFSKEGNWFYKRFQQIFQKWRQYYFLCIFQVLLTDATLGPEIACVDNKVVSVSYSFQSGWMNLERELDLFTK